MDIYKTFLYDIRKLSFVDPFLKVHGDVTPTLRNYIKILDNIQFEDGSYHKYYGDVKKTVNCFITCWDKTMDEAYKVADKYTHVITKDELLDLMETTVRLHQTKQIDFARDFLPVKTQLEEEIYKEVERNFDNFMGRLDELRSEIEKLDKQEKINEFAKKHFPVSLHKKNEVFLFTHTYISLLLTDPLILDKLRVSLEETLLRARNNLECLQEKCTSSINSLLNQLYDKNKEHINIFRQETRSSLEIAEVQRSMEIIKDKIEDSKHIPIARLVEEFKYWEDRLAEFNQIFNAVMKLNVEEKTMLEQVVIFNEIECPLIGPRAQCWSETEKILQENLRAIKEMKSNAAKALMTFLCVRGPDRTIYTDNIGPYYIDEYGHRVYFFDYGLKEFHIDCEGNFVQPNDSEKYYYDAMGRYVVDADGSKLYKIGACTSTYKLRGDVFEKHTKDCGHSQRDMKGCRMRVRDPNDITFLPLVKDVDLNEILDPDTSKYLWASFGHILPLALHDVAAAQPRNPIHYLAHKLLFHKYSKSKSDLEAMKAEAEKYRQKVFQDQKDQAIAASKEWKEKQVQRRKPEESDSTADWLAYDAYRARQQHVADLNYFYE